MMDVHEWRQSRTVALAEQPPKPLTPFDLLHVGELTHCIVCGRPTPVSRSHNRKYFTKQYCSRTCRNKRRLRKRVRIETGSIMDRVAELLAEIPAFLHEEALAMLCEVRIAAAEPLGSDSATVSGRIYATRRRNGGL